MTQQLLMVGTAIGTIAGLPIVFQFARKSWAEKNWKNIVWGGVSTAALASASYWYITQYAKQSKVFGGEGGDHTHYDPASRSFNAPAPPSTSGRTFLPQSQVLSLLRDNPNTIFSIQFEKRDGTLRNMNARTGVYRPRPDGTQRITGAGMKYNPSDFELRTVWDMQKDAYRHIAVDRVTRITIGGQTYRTASAQ